MARFLRGKRTNADPVAAAARQLTATGVSLMPSFDLTRSLGVGREVWTRFARHWEQLAPDPDAAELGARRLRRYGQYSLRDGIVQPMPDHAFAQPEGSNLVLVDRDLEFEPLTDAFAEDPLLHGLVKLLGRVAAALDDVAEWNIEVHPLRIRSSADDEGATPEDMHPDDVTLVSTLLVGRRNAIGGESSVCDLSGRRLLTATLTEPGTLLLGDDRRTRHGVSPVRPIDSSGPAQRDVLVITFASRWP
jgi:hypothetical protein